MANTANILARYRREADASSAAANRENIATGEANWSGGYWSGGDQFGGFGYPYYWNWYPYWGWGYPYSYSYYSYYPYRYYPSYWYDYDYYRRSASRRQFFGP
jgi:hypothetical protein